MKYHLISYGCQMNTADSEEMAQPLLGRGFISTAHKEQADIIIMNTCTVREHAEHKAISNLGRLRTWKEQDSNRILIVAGCAASLWGESVKKKYPYVDLVSPATQIEKFPEVIAQVLKDRWNWEVETTASFDGATKRQSEGATHPFPLSLRPSVSPPLSPFLFGTEATAYVTIMRGCNLGCSYCIVPQVRGREKYRPMPEILEQIKKHVQEGHDEVMLLGQTVNSYFWRDPENPSHVYEFADLLRQVDALSGVKSIRFMSPHPKHMRTSVIEAMAQCSKVARHLHLPVQSGSNRLLERMKRLYTRDDYVAITDRLREAIPGIALTTDFIVGYPGENPSDFADSLTLMEAVRFDGIFAFKYSPRPGTASAEEADNIPEAMKEDRLQQILALNQKFTSARMTPMETSV